LPLQHSFREVVTQPPTSTSQVAIPTPSPRCRQGANACFEILTLLPLHGSCATVHRYVLVLDQSHRLGSPSQMRSQTPSVTAPVGARSFAPRIGALSYPSPSPTDTTQVDIHLTHQSRSLCSNSSWPHDQIHLHFIQTHG
jgi:hypothetical protein